MSQVKLLVHIIALTLLSATLQVGHAATLDILPKHCHFSNQFKQTKKIPSLPVPLISSGKMYFSCQAGLIWETQKPIQEILILTQSDYHFKQFSNSKKSSETKLKVLDSIETRYLSRLLIGLMSADKDYINRTFNINNTDALTFELTPKNNFLSKVIKTVRIKRPQQDNAINIILNQQDGTLINIQTHSAIILDNSSLHMAYCLQSNHEKKHCLALFEPLKMANQLNEIISN